MLALGQVPPSANWTGKFNTVNYRFPLTLCTTEHVYFFTDSTSKDFQVQATFLTFSSHSFICFVHSLVKNGGQVGFVAVGAHTGKVCKTTTTVPDPAIPLCKSPSRMPDCWN
jgi:hypothetical protein